MQSFGEKSGIFAAAALGSRANFRFSITDKNKRIFMEKFSATEPGSPSVTYDIQPITNLFLQNL